MAQRYADLAMASLGQCRLAGFLRLPMNVKQLERDRDLNPLRPRPDFQAMMLDLAFPADPLARWRPLIHHVGGMD